MMTRQMNRFLLGESKAPVTKPEDEWLQAIHMAGSIGVNVELQGDPPKERTARILLAAAVRECAANTVKHAEGNTLRVDIQKNASGFHMTLTNNGKPPKRPVVESGGLLALRRSVEGAGGQMLVQSLPTFSLMLSIP